MAYTQNEKSTGLDALTDIAQNDLVIFGDVSDSGFAKAITKENLEIDIANSPTFINNLVANSTFITGSNPLTTKGDIYIRGTTGVTRLPVGADGQVLSADSTEANGLIWADVQAGGGGGGTKLAIDTNEVTVTATVAETTLFTVPIAPGTLGTNDAIRFFIYGTMQNPGTFTFRVKYGATTLTTFTHTLSTANSYNALLKGIIVADNSLSAQKAQTEFIAKHNPNAGFEGKTGIGTSVINSTLAHDLVITVENSDVAGTITVESILVEKLSSSQDGIVIYPDASEDLVIGTPVGISNGLNAVAKASTDFKSAVLSNIGASPQIKASKESFATLGNSKYAFIMRDANNQSLRAYVSTINRSTTTPTVGSDALFTNVLATTNPYAIVKLDTDKFVALYSETGSNTILRAIVCTVAGTTITASSPASIYTAGSNITNITASFLGTDKFVLFTKSTTNTDNVGIVCTVSGTTITAGTAQTPPSDTGLPESVIRIDVDKFALAGKRLSPADGTVVVGTIAGTVITFGTAVDFDVDANVFGEIGITSHIDDAFAISWKPTAFDTLDLIAGTVSGTAVTLGTAIVSASTEGGYVNRYSNNSVYVAGATGGLLNFYTIAGTTLTTLKTSSFITSNFLIINLVTMEDGYYVSTHVNVATSTARIFIEGMSNNFIGVVQNTVSRNGTAIVRISGVDANQTGLSAGEVYITQDGAFVRSNRTTALTMPQGKFVRAISSTTISI